MHHYWFRPKKVLGWFACYYPVNAAGWIVTIGLAAIFMLNLMETARASGSLGETLLGILPAAIFLALVFDIITLHTGEYPSWWKKR